MDVFWERVDEIWNDFHKDLCQGHVDNIPERTQEIINRKVGPTKY